MKKIFFYIITFFILIGTFILPVFAEGESRKVFSVKYDNASSMVLVTTKDSAEKLPSQLKYVPLSNPNRIYFDINNAVLIGEKQNLVFENSAIKEIKLAQFGTEPNIVRVVITFEEDFDTSKIKLITVDNSIVVKLAPYDLKNDYFNIVYDENPQVQKYSNISVNSYVIRRVNIPNAAGVDNVINDIKQAFAASTLSNTDGNAYDTTVSVDLSSSLKLRTKYYINQYIPKNNGLLVSGLGQVSTAKVFYLKSPDRVVIDMPNTYLSKSIRNNEINLCADGSCKDTAKIGQFDKNTARLVINSDKPDKYLIVYSQDAQSLFVIDSAKLQHKQLSSTISNINKLYVKKYDSRTNELILSFSEPIVYSIMRTDNSLTLFLFNVQSYNEQDIIKTLNNTYYKPFTLSLLPQIGVKAAMSGLSKEDVIKIEQSVDSKALKLTIVKSKQEEIRAINEKPFKKRLKDKIVLDAGHGGSDYGAIREGINEKDITLDVTRRIEAILRSKGYKTALTRTDDTFVSLEDRVNFAAAEEPEIFVSVHVNSAVSSDPNGIEIHWYHEHSKGLAEIVHKHLVKEIPDSKDRGLFKSKFYVINHTEVPAILCEIGFLSNETERNDLITDARKQKTAKAIAEGIMEYLKSVNKGGK